MHTVGALDLNHPSTGTAVEQIRRVIEAMRSHRILFPK